MTPPQKALLQQAKDALESVLKAHRVHERRGLPDTHAEAERIRNVIIYAVSDAENAIAALQAAIDTPGPEPEAWIGVHVFDALKAGKCVTSTMTKHKAFEDDVQIFTRPPAVREPLTEAEIIKIAQDNLAADPGRDGYILPIKFARAIEAAHGIKP